MGILAEPRTKTYREGEPKRLAANVDSPESVSDYDWATDDGTVHAQRRR